MDREQYAQQLEPLLRPATAYARSLLRDRHHAQDAVQQAALRALERLDTFDESRSFRAWWFTIVHRCCIDIIRANRHAKHVEFDADELPGADELDRSAGIQLSEAIATLSDHHQEILRLKYFADLSYKEIADTLNIAQGTVMSRLHLARLALAAKMKEEE